MFTAPLDLRLVAAAHNPDGWVVTEKVSVLDLGISSGVPDKRCKGINRTQATLKEGRPIPINRIGTGGRLPGNPALTAFRVRGFGRRAAFMPLHLP